MFERKQLSDLQEYFLNLHDRKSQCVYFYRINGYSEEIRQFLKRYYEAARTTGVVIEGKIPNPDERNLDYYEEIVGVNFQLSMGFLISTLQKWLPRLNPGLREQLAMAVYDTLDAMRRQGKNENMLRNAYIKFMCWLYYKFERILNRLGQDQLPKILYEGEISSYELRMLSILSAAGADAVLLQYQGDAAYLRSDPQSEISLPYEAAGLTAFPQGFCLAKLREDAEREKRRQQLYGTPQQTLNCTNAWITGKVFDDILKAPGARGNDRRLFYNCFCRISGVEDRLTYVNELYQFGMQLKNEKRRTVIVEGAIPKPTPEEIAQIKRQNYADPEQMISDLARNIQYGTNSELQRILRKSFIDEISRRGKEPNARLNRLTNLAVYLLCWLKRYQREIYGDWNSPDVGCFIYLGGCQSDAEAGFLKMLARTPADVLILTPDLSIRTELSDPLLFEKQFTESLTVDRFPLESTAVQMETAAYHAERELDTLIYQDSGVYRNYQHDRAVSITLRTMYEEIDILWDQELKYRPNFSVVNGVVSMPVIFAKVCGMKEEQPILYWQHIKRLITKDTFVVKEAPFLKGIDANPVKPHATGFFRNGKLQKDIIRRSPAYQYGILREDMQNYMLDKLEQLIEQRLIRGTYENGMEYTIVSVALNLDKVLVRLIQKFDFTKKNPKLIYINTTETMASLEDSILAAFLNLIGFDILIFVPTGYQSVERYYDQEIMEEHQAGDYIYDLQVPNFDYIASGPRQSWIDRIFKRGN